MNVLLERRKFILKNLAFFSPYSAQATAALLAQFPTQWPTIRDYGFAHPEIVGYMNAYAPEDAKIAYSLVEGIGTRYLTTNGEGAYIKFGFLATSMTMIHVVFKLNQVNITDESAYVVGNSQWGDMIRCNNTNGQSTLTSIMGRLQGKEFQYTPYSLGTRYEVRMTASAASVNGASQTLTSGASRGVGNATLFANLARTSLMKSYLSIALAEIEHGGGSLSIIPFRNSSLGLGMLDMATGDFYKNEGTGTFTELIEAS